MIADQLRTKMILMGHPSCINTAKCLQTAAEKGVDVDPRVIASNTDPELLKMSPLGIAPVLIDVDYVVYGTLAVLSYLDDKGFGPSLIPRNGVVRSIMYQWICVAMDIQDSVASGDTGKAEPAIVALSRQLESPPARGDFICGQFSLADVHWTACCNMLYVKGQGDVMTPVVRNWFEMVKKHPSTSKEKITPYEMVPTAGDMEKGLIRGISINV